MTTRHYESITRVFRHKLNGFYFPAMKTHFVVKLARKNYKILPFEFSKVVIDKKLIFKC